MKLLKQLSCHWENCGGNVKTVTALGEAFTVTPSDRGSTPRTSTIHINFSSGDVAQLGEHHNGIVGVESSSLFVSTEKFQGFRSNIEVSKSFLIFYKTN